MKSLSFVFGLIVVASCATGCYARGYYSQPAYYAPEPAYQPPPAQYYPAAPPPVLVTPPPVVVAPPPVPCDGWHVEGGWRARAYGHWRW